MENGNQLEVSYKSWSSLPYSNICLHPFPFFTTIILLTRALLYPFSMASSSSSSRNWRYHVFPSFRGEDVRNSFLSHLLMELRRKLITTFIDHGIDRSRPIGPELLLAIKDSRIAIVIFSKNYASSTWCLNELVEIHTCFKDLDQMVIPIFYHVDPSEVRKQTGEFGERFNETCKDKTEDDRERWIRALKDVANLAGEDSKNWIGEGEAKMIEHIAKDVLNKLMIPSNDFSEIVGIEAHFKRLNWLLCLESKEVRWVGIWGPSGVGKSTIGRALFSQLSSLFHKHAFFVSYKSTNERGNNSTMKLCLDERLLSEILCEKDVKIRSPGVVKEMLNHKKVFIIVDDVDDVEALNTLTDQTSLVGSGSRIVVITQDKRLLESQRIELIYEVELPSYYLAMQMFCRSAFGKNSPPCGFEELAEEVVLHSSNLPLGLSVLGSSLKGMNKEEWVKMRPRLLNSLGRKIKNTLKVCYDRLNVEEQELFLCIACLFDGYNVNFLNDFLGDSAAIGLKILKDKSLIRRESTGIVRMHSLLQKLGKEINCADPINNRRFLTEAEDICDVLTDTTGTKNTLAMYLNMSEINESLSMDENSFQGMRNLKLLHFYKSRWSRETGKGRLTLPDRGLHHFPRKLKFLHWDEYPSKFMPFNFRAECLVELSMENSKLEKLWEGTQFLGNLKEMDMSYSVDLKEIPNLAKAINVKELYLSGCTSLVTLPSSIGNLSRLSELDLSGCTSLVRLHSSIGNLSRLSELDLWGCSSLARLPSSIGNLSRLSELNISGCSSLVTLPSSIGNLSKLLRLKFVGCTFLVTVPSSIGNLSKLYELDFTECSSLVTLPFSIGNLSKLYILNLRRCSSLVTLPSSIGNLIKLYKLDVSKCSNLTSLYLEETAFEGVENSSWIDSLTRLKELLFGSRLPEIPAPIGNLHQLEHLNMEGCTMLEVLPVNIDVGYVLELNLSGCSKMRNFPQISTIIRFLYLDDTAIEEIPSWIKNMSQLRKLRMRRCKNLKNISAEIFKLECDKADFSDCGGITTICDHLPGPPQDDFFEISSYSSYGLPGVAFFKFNNCFSLDGDAQEIIIQSCPIMAVIPGGEVPMYYTHQACGSSLSILLSESSLSEESILLQTCIVVGPSSHKSAGYLIVRQSFRGQEEEFPCHFNEDACTYEMDHLVLFVLYLQIEQVDNSPSELNDDVLLLEFYSSHYDKYCQGCTCGSNGHEQNSTPVEIKGCGARVMMDISETDCEESDEESIR